MKNFILVFCALLSSHAALANLDGFVKLPSGNELYVNYLAAERGKPTVVLLNGLTYSTREWNIMSYDLSKEGLGVLRYDMYGQGETLRRSGMVFQAITHNEQANDLAELLNHLKIKKVHLAGLSYGGGIAMSFASTYPDKTASVILLAPFTEAVKSQDEWVKKQIAVNRQLFPFNPATDDELYDFFLRNLIYTTYPAAEPSIMNQAFKLDAVYQLVRGIRKFKALDVADEIPNQSMHLVIAANDQYIERDIMNDFWKKFPAKKLVSKILVQYSEHKIPEAVPHFAAGWIREIMLGNKYIKNGISFIGNPLTGEAVAGGTTIVLPKK